MISCQNLNVCADVKGYAKTYFDQMSSLLGAAEKSILVKTLVILVVKKGLFSETFSSAPVTTNKSLSARRKCHK